MGKGQGAFVVQANYRNWEGSRDFSVSLFEGRPVIYWVVKKILARWPNMPVVVAVPDVKENRIFEEALSGLSAKVFYGPEDDVLERLHLAGAMCGADWIVRVLGMHYFFDAGLVDSMIRLFSSNGYDVVKPPDDFDIKFGAEVVSLDALKRLRTYIESSEEMKKRIDIKIAPIHYISARSDIFKVGIYGDVPEYSKDKLFTMRSVARKIYGIYNGDHIPFHLTERPERSVLFKHYEIASQYVESSHSVLDVGCGDGYGANYLSKKAKRVVGLDVSQEQVKLALKRYAHRGLSFVTGDATSICFGDETFHVVVSMETIEHIEDDVRYLEEIRRVLKKDGLFIVSTPQNRYGSIPLIPSHVREYSLEGFRRLLTGSGFTIERIFAFKAGNLCIEDDPYGTGMMAICRKK